MYLYISEDGDIFRISAEEFEVGGESCLSAADDGFIDLIRIDGPIPMRYISGEWFPVEEI